MALINCPECEKQVSDKAVSCPNCGYPISQMVNSNSFKEGLKSSPKDYEETKQNLDAKEDLQSIILDVVNKYPKDSKVKMIKKQL